MTPSDVPTGDLPAYVQAILSVIAFLIAATAVWYAYFVRGKSGSKDHNGIDERVLHKGVQNLERIANSLESITKVIQKDSMEAEIRRRVDDEVEHEMKRRKQQTTKEK